MMATTNNVPVSDDFHKLVLVVKDLAQQLDENRQATAKLKIHADLLKVGAPYDIISNIIVNSSGADGSLSHRQS
jgi:hypothetical protein